MWILPTLRSKFGASLKFGSGVIVCQTLNSDTATFEEFHVLSDAAPCCFSEATLGEFSNGNTAVKVRCLCIVWFSRYNHYSERLPLNVMLLRNMMLYWTGSGGKKTSRPTEDIEN